MEAMNLRERSEWSDAIAAEIRAQRARANLTQAEVIERSGLGTSTYTRIEQGKRVPDVTQLWRICQALGVPPSELVARAERA